jgi:hypothetical protein
VSAAVGRRKRYTALHATQGCGLRYIDTVPAGQQFYAMLLYRIFPGRCYQRRHLMSRLEVHDFFARSSKPSQAGSLFSYATCTRADCTNTLCNCAYMFLLKSVNIGRCPLSFYRWCCLGSGGSRGNAGFTWPLDHDNGGD